MTSTIYNFKSVRKTLLLASVGLATLLTACDNIKSDERYILGEAVTAERAVLLEDFTGQNCLNCPEAHEVIEGLEEQFGSDKVIAVSIHCGSFGIPVKRTNFTTGNIGLMTDEGNAIMETYGIQSFPMGVIDMGSPETYDLWATSVRNAIQKSTDVRIELSATFIADAQQPENGYAGSIKAKAEIHSGTARTADVQFWIVENGIVARQKLPDGSFNDNYVHNNVFRGQMLNGIRGGSYTFANGFPTEVEAETQVRWSDKEHWEVPNLSVVCFVSDKTGVLQVSRVPVAAENRK